jgi:hypothetical protein
MEEFLNVDAEQGTFSLYAEFAAAEGRFKGYAKPIIENADFYRRGEEAPGPFRRAWEGLVDVARKIFENDEQLATQIPLSGEIENPDAGTLAAIVNVLRNAFVAAFTHSIDGTINLRDVDPDAIPDLDAAAEAEEEVEDENDE